MFKAILFDRDGVLVDSEGFHIMTVELALKEQNVVLSKEEKRQIPGRWPDDYLPEFRKNHVFDVEQAITFQDVYYTNNFSTVTIYTSVFDLIKKLKKKYLIGLTTSSDQGTTNQLLERAHATELFDEVTTYEKYENRKPHPDPYLYTAKALGVKPSECVVVEDSAVGVRAAKAAGMCCIAIPGVFTKNDDFSQSDKIISDIKMLEEFLLHHQ